MTITIGNAVRQDFHRDGKDFFEIRKKICVNKFSKCSIEANFSLSVFDPVFGEQCSREPWIFCETDAFFDEKKELRICVPCLTSHRKFRAQISNGERFLADLENVHLVEVYRNFPIRKPALIVSRLHAFAVFDGRLLPFAAVNDETFFLPEEKK